VDKRSSPLAPPDENEEILLKELSEDFFKMDDARKKTDVCKPERVPCRINVSY
jgi:hypothetical protein